jgi:hypothetical protein
MVAGNATPTARPERRVQCFFGAMIRTCGWPSAWCRERAHLPEDDLRVQAGLIMKPSTISGEPHDRTGARGRRRCPRVLEGAARGVPEHPGVALLVAQAGQCTCCAAEVGAPRCTGSDAGIYNADDIELRPHHRDLAGPDHRRPADQPDQRPRRGLQPHRQTHRPHRLRLPQPRRPTPPSTLSPASRNVYA